MSDLVDLDDQDRADVVFYLGYPAKIVNENSTHYSGIYDDRMNRLAPATVARVKELLALIKETRTQLDNTRADSHVNRVGEIGLSPQYVSTNIRAQYNRYIGELSRILDIPSITGQGTTVRF